MDDVEQPVADPILLAAHDRISLHWERLEKVMDFVAYLEGPGLTSHIRFAATLLVIFGDWHGVGRVASKFPDELRHALALCGGLARNHAAEVLNRHVDVAIARRKAIASALAA